MAILLDASFIWALNNNADIHHKAASAIWKELENEQKFISDYVIDEVLSVALRKVGKEHAKILGKHLLNSYPLLMLDRGSFNEAWILFQKENLSFTDCTLVVLAKLGKLTIATFDKELRKIYPDVLPR